MAQYKIRAYASKRHPQLNEGSLLLETQHTSHTSMDVETRAWRSRMAKGHPISKIEITRLDEPEPPRVVLCTDCTDADITQFMRAPPLHKRRTRRVKWQ